MGEKHRAGVRDEDRLPELTDGLLGLEIKEVVVAMDTEATLLYAMEMAGQIPPLKELQKPINRLVNNSTPSNEINDRRDDHSLDESEMASNARSELQQKITDLINERQEYSQEQISELRAWGRAYVVKKRGELPEVQVILKNLIFPEAGSDSREITKDSSEMAPDIYWMMLKEKAKADQANTG